ncbi:MAG: acyl-CoA dehydrogenase family protein [bacterium]
MVEVIHLVDENENNGNDDPAGWKRAREVIETARISDWDEPTFAGGLFMGDFQPDLVFPFPFQNEEDRREGDTFLLKLKEFLIEEVDADKIDREEEIPEKVIDGLAELGAFGMKVPEEYGGLGFSQINYNRAIAMVSSHCSSTALMLSAHQSIGVSRPVSQFGTPQQKENYLHAIAEGAISAFALTEPEVGSDPARMKTVAEHEGGKWVLNGRKLWCTNGLIADHILVISRTGDGKDDSNEISAFIVETDWDGVNVEQRCRFMGLNGIQNGLIRFDDVHVPPENLVGERGQGLKIALTILNTGRLTMPAMCVGAARKCHEIARVWCNEREQWGKPIGKHESVGGKLGYISSHLFAMEAVTWLTSGLEDRGGMDLRIEAAMAKLFCSETLWEIADETLQIRGGRGYERADSLKDRGELGYPVERILRDARLNRIGEGTSEILKMFIAREAVDPHMNIAGDLVKEDSSLGSKLRSVLYAGWRYSLWYPRQWIRWDYTPSIAKHGGEISRHLSFVKTHSHILSRTLFHAMVRYGRDLEQRHLLLERLVDVGTDLLDRVFTSSDEDLMETAENVMGGKMNDLESGIT